MMTNEVVWCDRPGCPRFVNQRAQELGYTACSLACGWYMKQVEWLTDSAADTDRDSPKASWLTEKLDALETINTGLDEYHGASTRRRGV